MGLTAPTRASSRPEQLPRLPFVAYRQAAKGSPHGRKGVAQHAVREEGRGVGGIATQRQTHGLPEPHPAGPDELADLVIALRLGDCHEGVSLHLHQKRFRVRRDQSHVSASHRTEGLLAVLHPVGLPLERQAGVLHAPHQSGDEYRPLARKEPEEVRPRDATRLAIASVDVP
jgi:hypothetical protein